MKPEMYLLFIIACLVLGCTPKDKTLPILSKQKEVNGQLEYQKIPAFSFYNQDSTMVSNQTFAHKAYVVDFFFISCPTICPVMQKNMLKIYNHFVEDSSLLLVSHTIDPKRDSVARLQSYAHNMGVSADKWHFLTGEKDDIYSIADDYFNIVLEDPDLPEGFDHSGRFVLVDPNGHIRAYCQGTDEQEVEAFIKNIEKLLHEI
jgi:protein SCO1/2